MKSGPVGSLMKLLTDRPEIIVGAVTIIGIISLVVMVWMLR